MKRNYHTCLFFLLSAGVLLLPLFLCNACRVQQIYNASLNPLAYELPNSSKDGQVIQHFAYTVSYNSKNLTANWVAYELTADETNGPWSRKGLRFFQDPDCGRQADDNDYRNSGYSRGHLAPAV